MSLLSTVNLSFFTTSKEEYLQLWDKANSSEYVNKFRGELWSWESGDKLYLVKIELLVNTKLPQVVVDRFLRMKLKVESYTNNLRTNSGKSTKEILPEQFNRYKPTVVEIKPPNSLLSTDLTKLKKLSLRAVKLPTPERKVEAPILVERPPTAEEINYSKLITINPLLEELVGRFDLVSNTTGERIIKTKLKEDINPYREAKIKTQEVDKTKLIALAERVIERENSYSKEDIVDRIKKATNVNQDRAEKGFNLILQAGAIEIISGERYCLIGSTPF